MRKCVSPEQVDCQRNITNHKIWECIRNRP